MMPGRHRYGGGQVFSGVLKSKQKRSVVSGGARGSTPKIPEYKTSGVKGGHRGQV